MSLSGPMKCRSCGCDTIEILDLGHSPPANRLAKHRDERIPTFPLGLVQCCSCGLVQNAANLSTELLFGKDYPYLSSVSSSVRANAQDLASQIAQRIGKDIAALDVGSNDGATQIAFRDVGIDCYGVDPALLAVSEAKAKGCDAHCGPFDAVACDAVLNEVGKVGVVTMSNVLAHVPLPGDLLSSAASVLSDNGLLVVEVQSWLDLVEIGAFDMVYHEHHAHYSLSSVLDLLGRHGFGADRVEKTAAQGGSLRIWCTHGREHTRTVRELAGAESRALKHAPERLGDSVQACQDSAGVFAAATEGRTVAGYGAAAKTVTMLAACGSSLGLTCVADNAPSKVGRFLPLYAVPIISPAEMLRANPDVILLFAWNLVDEILPSLEGMEVWVPMPVFRQIQ